MVLSLIRCQRLVFVKFLKWVGKLLKLTGCYLSRNFKIPPFNKIIDKVFTSRQKYEDKSRVQGLVILTMNILYGIQRRKDINEFFKSKSNHWM